MAQQKNETIMTRALMRKYEKLAKKADRRMREIERFSRYEEFKGIKNYAYKAAEKMIEQWTPPWAKEKERAPRWQRVLPTNKEGVVDTRTLKAKIKDIETFLNMKSSTVTGIKQIYQKRAKTLNERYGTNFKWQDLANFFEEGGIADSTFNEYGSKTVLVSIATIQKQPTKALNQIEKFNDNVQFIDDNKVLDETINNLLQKQGKNIKELIS